MSVPDAKAAMARAYASGKEPTLKAVHPSGTDEVWELDGVAFVVPAIPADAPPLLEYALRLRRDATLSGSCERCGTTFDMAPQTESFPSNVSEGFFPHRNNCPAADENVLPLFEAYYKRHAESDPQDNLNAASRRTREQLKPVFENGTEIKTSASVRERAEQFLDRKLQETKGRACPHIKAQPAQTWHINLWDDMWRCDECHLRFAESFRTGNSRLDPIEDHSCDYCRRYTPRTMQPMVMRMGIHVMYGAICRRCRGEWEQLEKES